MACDTDFNNQNSRQTQITNNWWRDAYIVDNFGDRHYRVSGYFVNGEGQPRETIDIPYGQSARYIMMFNDVSQNVSTVSLHSQWGNLDIENMSLDGAAVENASAQAPAASPSAAQSAVSNAAASTKDTLTTAGKQQAQDAQQKAVSKGQDALNKILGKMPH